MFHVIKKINRLDDELTLYKDIIRAYDGSSGAGAARPEADHGYDVPRTTKAGAKGRGLLPALPARDERSAKGGHSAPPGAAEGLADDFLWISSPGVLTLPPHEVSRGIELWQRDLAACLSDIMAANSETDEERPAGLAREQRNAVLSARASSVERDVAQYVSNVGLSLLVELHLLALKQRYMEELEALEAWYREASTVFYSYLNNLRSFRDEAADRPAPMASAYNILALPEDESIIIKDIIMFEKSWIDNTDNLVYGGRRTRDAEAATSGDDGFEGSNLPCYNSIISEFSSRRLFLQDIRQEDAMARLVAASRPPPSSLNGQIAIDDRSVLFNMDNIAEVAARTRRRCYLQHLARRALQLRRFMNGVDSNAAVEGQAGGTMMPNRLAGLLSFSQQSKIIGTAEAVLEWVDRVTYQADPTAYSRALDACHRDRAETIRNLALCIDDPGRADGTEAPAFNPPRTCKYQAALTASVAGLFRLPPLAVDGGRVKHPLDILTTVSLRAIADRLALLASVSHGIDTGSLAAGNPYNFAEALSRQGQTDGALSLLEADIVSKRNELDALIDYIYSIIIDSGYSAEVYDNHLEAPVDKAPTTSSSATAQFRLPPAAMRTLSILRRHVTQWLAHYTSETISEMLARDAGGGTREDPVSLSLALSNIISFVKKVAISCGLSELAAGVGSNVAVPVGDDDDDGPLAQLASIISLHEKRYAEEQQAIDTNPPVASYDDIMNTNRDNNNESNSKALSVALTPAKDAAGPGSVAPSEGDGPESGDREQYNALLTTKPPDVLGTADKEGGSDGEAAVTLYHKVSLLATGRGPLVRDIMGENHSCELIDAEQIDDGAHPLAIFDRDSDIPGTRSESGADERERRVFLVIKEGDQVTEGAAMNDKAKGERESEDTSAADESNDNAAQHDVRLPFPPQQALLYQLLLTNLGQTHEALLQLRIYLRQVYHQRRLLVRGERNAARGSADRRRRKRQEAALKAAHGTEAGDDSQEGAVLSGGEEASYFAEHLGQPTGGACDDALAPSREGRGGPKPSLLSLVSTRVEPLAQQVNQLLLLLEQLPLSPLPHPRDSIGMIIIAYHQFLQDQGDVEYSPIYRFLYGNPGGRAIAINDTDRVDGALVPAEGSQDDTITRLLEDFIAHKEGAVSQPAEPAPLAITDNRARLADGVAPALSESPALAALLLSLSEDQSHRGTGRAGAAVALLLMLIEDEIQTRLTPRLGQLLDEIENIHKVAVPRSIMKLCTGYEE